MVRNILALFISFCVGYSIGFIVGNLAYEAVSALEEWDYIGGVGEYSPIDGDY